MNISYAYERYAPKIAELPPNFQGSFQIRSVYSTR